MDTEGNRIEAHGAGMLQSPNGNRWYRYGESKKTSDNSDHGVNCYSAETIAGPWRFEGQVLRQQDIAVDEIPAPFIVERPKVLFNPETSKFATWLHSDACRTAKPSLLPSPRRRRAVGFAVGSLRAGPRAAARRPSLPRHVAFQGSRGSPGVFCALRQQWPLLGPY